MYYRVKKKLKLQDIPKDFHEWGYEDENTFLSGLNALHTLWKGWTGRCLEDLHRFRRLRFRNAYGGYEEAWLPDFMLEATPDPEGLRGKDKSNVEDLLNRTFGME